MGVPARSVNCFEGCGFLPFAVLPLGTGAMRVPSPAAGMMTMTFIAGCKYTDAERQLQIAPGKRAHRMRPSCTANSKRDGEDWPLANPRLRLTTTMTRVLVRRRLWRH